MTGRHRMPTSVRRPPAQTYARYSGRFLTVACVNGAVLLFGVVFAVGSGVAPQVHGQAVADVQPATDIPTATTTAPTVIPTQPPVIATSARLSASRVVPRVLTTPTLTTVTSQQNPAPVPTTTVAPTTTTGITTATATTTAKASRTRPRRTTTAPTTSEATVTLLPTITIEVLP